MESHIGKRLRLKCVLKENGEKKTEQEESVEDLSSEAVNILGINVDIE
ncbi:MAG: hypothetical protein ACLTK0_06990 [Anaerovoracaceae bacterium]